ncbi:MAG TPA: hypothetical protein DCG33_03260, partial [Prevotellaceae bacterium]|nr:hypothetical protein [Prevotellaceae bacterium]
MSSKSSIDKIVTGLVTAISESDKKKRTAYDTTATVTRIEDNIVWVKIPGGEDDTPVQKTIDAKPGETVRVRVSNHRAFLIGNSSSPPTDDTTANYATNLAYEANQTIVQVQNIVTKEINAQNAVIDNLEADTAKIHDLTADQLYSTVGYIDDLTAGNIKASDIISDHADIGTIKATKADVEDLHATNAEIETLKTSKADAEDLTATNAEIESLKTSKADISALNAEKARIDDLEADHVSTSDLTATNAEITSLKANKADVTDLNAANAKITNLESTKADISVLEAGYAKIDLANVNNAYIKNGVFDTAAIVDEQVFTVTGNKATIKEINADEINVRNLNAKNLKIETADGYIQLGDKKTPTKEFIDSLTDELNDRIDGAIETYTSTAVPTLSNYPASSWTTAEERAAHVGDVCYVVNDQIAQNGYCYRFTLSGSTFSWQLIKDSDVTAALQRLQTAEGKIEGIESFDEEIASFKTDTEGELSSLKIKTTSLETSLGDKVDKTTFNEVKQTVDENSATISTLSTTVSKKADSSTVTTLSNTVNSVSQKANANEAAISDLTETVESKADGSTVTTLTQTVNDVKQTATSNSSTISQLTTTLGTNADGTTKAGDIVHRTSSVEQDLSGFKTTVSQTYHKTSDFNTYKTSNDSAVAAAKKAGTDAQSNLDTYKTSNDKAVAAAKKAGDDAQADLDAYKGTVEETYATKSALTQTESNIKSEVSSTYATKTSVPTKVSQLSNDSKFATQTQAQGYANTAEGNAKADATAKANAAEANAKADTTEKLKSYSTTAQMNSAIDQKADAINLSMSQTYTTKIEFENLEIGGRNLFAISKATKHYYPKSDGSLGYDINCIATDFIPVTAGETLLYQVWVPESANTGIWWPGFIFYDSEKAVTQGTSSGRMSIGYALKTVVVPDGSSYMRTCVEFIDWAGDKIDAWLNGDDECYVQIEKGTKPTAWSLAPEDA